MCYTVLYSRILLKITQTPVHYCILQGEKTTVKSFRRLAVSRAVKHNLHDHISCTFKCVQDILSKVMSGDEGGIIHGCGLFICHKMCH